MNHIIEGRQKRGRAALEAIATRATTMFGAQAVLAVDGDADRVERIVAAETGIEKQGPSRVHSRRADAPSFYDSRNCWGPCRSIRDGETIRYEKLAAIRARTPRGVRVRDGADRNVVGGDRVDF